MDVLQIVNASSLADVAQNISQTRPEQKNGSSKVSAIIEYPLHMQQDFKSILTVIKSKIINLFRCTM